MQQIIHLQVSERLLSFFWSNIFYSFLIPRFLFVSPLTLWQKYASFHPPKSNPAPNPAILHFLVRQPLSFCNFLYSVKTKIPENKNGMLRFFQSGNRSIHNLTQRSTFVPPEPVLTLYLSTHDLTQRSTSIFHIFYAKFRSYFLYFSQKPL